MRNDQAEMVAQLANEALEVVRKAEACTVANGIIKAHIGFGNRVLDMPAFYSELVQALKKAREQGREDCSDEDVLLAAGYVSGSQRR